MLSFAIDDVHLPIAPAPFRMQGHSRADIAEQQDVHCCCAIATAFFSPLQFLRPINTEEKSKATKLTLLGCLCDCSLQFFPFFQTPDARRTCFGPLHTQFHSVSHSIEARLMRFEKNFQPILPPGLWTCAELAFENCMRHSQSMSHRIVACKMHF